MKKKTAKFGRETTHIKVSNKFNETHKNRQQESNERRAKKMY